MKYASLIFVVFLGLTGCLEGTTMEDESAITSPEAQRELMGRWNGTVDTSPPDSYDFHWPHFDKFPHPTYKGGDEDAYQTFATILLAFLEQGDNFDYLAGHHYFDATLSYVFPSGDGDSWTFRELVNDLSSDDWAIDQPTRDELKDMAARIDDVR